MQVRIAGIAGMALSPFAGRLAAKFGLLRVLHRVNHGGTTDFLLDEVTGA